MYGELNHPDRMDVYLANVSHVIKDFTIEHGILYGEVEVLDTPMGNKLQYLVEKNLVVFRPRATGIVNGDGTIDEYNIYTFDAVLAKDDGFDKIYMRRIKLINIMENINKKRFG